jgi:hypothetical protein
VALALLGSQHAEERYAARAEEAFAPTIPTGASRDPWPVGRAPRPSACDDRHVHIAAMNGMPSRDAGRGA